MKHQFTVILAVLMLSASCSGGSDAGQAADASKQMSLMDLSKHELATAVAERDTLLRLVMEIASGMEQIKRMENVMVMSGARSDDKVSQRSQLIADISAIRRTIRRQRGQLAELEKRSQESALSSAELSGTIESLRRLIDTQTREIESLQSQLSEANERIGTLNSTVDSLNCTVEAVTDTLDATRATSNELANELNTCYYVVATKQVLREHRIIETGFLRKTKLLKGDFDRDIFTVSDKRHLGRISLGSGKAKIHTNHPAGSYELTDHNGMKMLHITDPAEFWSLTNYLVLEID